MHCRELPAGIKVNSVKISAFSTDHGQLQVALRRSWWGAWGRRRVWLLGAGLGNKYQQQARSTGRPRWASVGSVAFLVSFNKIWESRVHLWANRPRREGNHPWGHSQEAQRRTWGYGLMEEFSNVWFCPTGMTSAHHLLSPKEIISCIFILSLCQSFILAEAFKSGYLDRHRPILQA